MKSSNAFNKISFHLDTIYEEDEDNYSDSASDYEEESDSEDDLTSSEKLYLIQMHKIIQHIKEENTSFESKTTNPDESMSSNSSSCELNSEDDDLAGFSEELTTTIIFNSTSQVVKENFSIEEFLS